MAKDLEHMTPAELKAQADAILAADAAKHSAEKAADAPATKSTRKSTRKKDDGAQQAAVVMTDEEARWQKVKTRASWTPASSWTPWTI